MFKEFFNFCFRFGAIIFSFGLIFIGVMLMISSMFFDSFSAMILMKHVCVFVVGFFSTCTGLFIFTRTI